MKKFLIIVAISALILGILTACTVPEADVLAESVSYVEKTLYHGDIDGYAVEITVGEAEEPRITDGKVGELKPFIKIAVIPLAAGAEIESITYSFCGAEGELERSLTRYSYETTLKSDAVSAEIKLVINGDEQTVALNEITSGYIDWKEAVKIAGAEFSAIIEKETAEGIFMRETQVRITRNTLGGKPFYYYVAAVKPDEEFPSAAALIDPVAKKTVAVRK